MTIWIGGCGSGGGGGGGITELTDDVLAGPGSGAVSATVVGLQGNPISPALPTLGQVLQWNGLAWVPTSLLQSVEIDFGSGIPQREASFLIVDALVTPATRIVAWESADTATGRVGVDQEWDQLILAARAAAGSFTLYVTAVPGPVLGRRVIFYQRG